METLSHEKRLKILQEEASNTYDFILNSERSKEITSVIAELATLAGLIRGLCWDLPDND